MTALKGENLIALIKPTLWKIIFTILLFVSASWISQFLSSMFIMDVTYTGFPLHFRASWGPCQIGSGCSEFNGLYLVLDILIWYVISAFFVQGIKMVMHR